MKIQAQARTHRKFHTQAIIMKINEDSRKFYLQYRKPHFDQPHPDLISNSYTYNY